MNNDTSGSGNPPQSPFQVAPLFVRDRYGSQDSTYTLDGAEQGTETVTENPWSGSEALEDHLKKEQEKQKTQLPPVDGGFKAWSIIGVAFLLEGLLWSEFSSTNRQYIELTIYLRFPIILRCIPRLLLQTRRSLQRQQKPSLCWCSGYWTSLLRGASDDRPD